MNVMKQLTIVPQTLPARTQTDHIRARATSASVETVSIAQVTCFKLQNKKLKSNN